MPMKRYSSQYNALTGKMLAFYASEHTGENVFISPLSILILLSLAADSTAGTTREEILQVLQDPSGDHLHGLVLGSFQKLLSRTGAFSSANAVCLREDFAPTLNRPFLDHFLPVYDGEVFAGKDMVNDVNRWIHDKTKGLVSKVADESMSDMLFSIINAVAFDAKWDCPFMDYQIKDKYFHNADGSRSRVMMLHGKESSYIEDDTFIGFVKPYEKNDFSFMALLPRKEKELPDLQKIHFTELFHSAHFDDVHIQLPEFSFSFCQNFNSFCFGEGIEEIFSDHADFSRLSSAWLKAEQIIHKTFIEVNQDGTRAAAVSMCAVMAGCLPPQEFKEVFLDRPFIFAIVHSETGIPVFVGTVNHLDDAKVRPRRLVEKLKN